MGPLPPAEQAKLEGQLEAIQQTLSETRSLTRGETMSVEAAIGTRSRRNQFDFAAPKTESIPEREQCLTRLGEPLDLTAYQADLPNKEDINAPLHGHTY